MSTSEPIAQLYKDMVQVRESVKLLHFQTTNFNVHKITDTYLAEYDQMFDAFWEVIQSDQFRINFPTAMTLNIVNVREYKDLAPILDKVLNQLKQIPSDNPAKVSAENLIERTEQFKYLLTFN